MYYYHRILYTLHYVLQTLKHTWICSLHNIFPSVKHTCTIHKVHIATQKMVSHSEGNMNDRSFISHTTLILTNDILEVMMKWLCDVMLWHKSSMLHVLAESVTTKQECGTFRLVTSVQGTRWMYAEGQRPELSIFLSPVYNTSWEAAPLAHVSTALISWCSKLQASSHM